MISCGGDDSGKLGDKCDPLDENACSTGLECAETTTGDSLCYPPVILAGHVTSTEDGGAIAGAHVIALDQQKSPVTDVAVTDAAGSYELDIPAVRGADGAPASSQFTLTASAADYLKFPKGMRPALPIEASTATKEQRGWVIESALTDIALIPLTTTGLSRISGRVDTDQHGGVLVVAEVLDNAGDVVTGSGLSGLTDRSGEFTIFNVPDGTYTLRGYRADVQVTPEEVTVAGADSSDVVLTASTAPLSEITGNVINNSPDYTLTSVVLIPKAVFDEVFVRGEVPPGLRAPRFGAPDVTTSFTITGVPDGQYVVLAAFENDGLVRDESGGGNTAIVEVSVPDATAGNSVALASGFKVRSALAVVSPGAEAPERVGDGVTTPFDLVFGRYSNAKTYDVQVINALGELVWEQDNVPQPAGSGDITISYAGPELEPGMYYQFRASAWDDLGNVLSRTEDLRGVFFLAQ